MATVAHTRPTLEGLAKGLLFSWTPLTNVNTDGQVVSPGACSGLFFQVTGTFGSATIVLQGSNDGTNWVTLNAPDGTDISLAVAGAFEVLERPLYVRVNTSGGDGTQSLTATLYASR